MTAFHAACLPNLKQEVFSLLRHHVAGMGLSSFTSSIPESSSREMRIAFEKAADLSISDAEVRTALAASLPNGAGGTPGAGVSSAQQMEAAVAMTTAIEQVRVDGM
jgi:hypothetical protein